MEHPSGPEVWTALQTEFAAELQQIETGSAVEPVPELDDTGVPWVPRIGGRANLGAELDRTARTGGWDRSRYADRSEARMAILCAAAARGWRLADVRSRSPPEPGRASRGCTSGHPNPAGWNGSSRWNGENRSAFVAGEKNVRHWLTSDVNHAPPARSLALMSSG